MWEKGFVVLGILVLYMLAMNLLIPQIVQPPTVIHTNSDIVHITFVVEDPPLKNWSTIAKKTTYYLKLLAVGQIFFW
jgi:hypothetical protein